MIYTEEISVKVGSGEFINITEDVLNVIKKSGVKNGICIVFSKGSTGAVIINEDEENLINDLKNTLEEITPSGEDYNHPENAFSHIRTSLLGPSEIIIIKDSQPVFGTWQEIMIYNGDTFERKRKIVITVIGE